MKRTTPSSSPGRQHMVVNVLVASIILFSVGIAIPMALKYNRHVAFEPTTVVAGSTTLEPNVAAISPESTTNPSLAFMTSTPVELVPYPSLAGFSEMTQFELRMGEVNVPVYEGPAGYFVVVRATGPVKLTLERLDQRIERAVLRPLPRNPVPFVSAGVVSFQLSGPGSAAIELNGDQANPVFFFVKPPEVQPDRESVTHFFESGTVHDLPNGKLLLKSGESAFIAGGAVVRGSIETRGSREAPVKGVRILGQGLLMPTEQGQPIAIMNTEDALVEGITLLNTLGWTFRVFESKRVRVEGVHIFAAGIYSDGLDIMGSQEVEVRDSFVHSHDDCIAIKGAKWIYSGNVEHILLDNLWIWKAAAGNGIEIGYETDVDYIRNIVVRNIAIMHLGRKEHPFRRAGLSIHHSGRAEISNILYEDITIEQASENLIYLWVGRSHFAKADELGSIRDVMFRRVHYIDGSPVPSVIESSEAPGKISGIAFDDCKNLGRKLTAAEDFGLQCIGSPPPTFR